MYDHPDYAEVQQQLHERVNELREEFDNTIGGSDHPDLGKVKGITGVRWVEGGWVLTGTGEGAFAVQPLDEPTDSLAVTCVVKSQREDGIRNGQIALSDDGGETVVRAGVYMGAGEYVIIGPENEVLVKLDFATLNAADDFELFVEVSDEELSLTVNGGVEIRTALPEGFGPITHVGYGLNNTATRFTGLTVEVNE